MQTFGMTEIADSRHNDVQMHFLINDTPRYTAIMHTLCTVLLHVAFVHQIQLISNLSKQLTMKTQHFTLTHSVSLYAGA